MSKIVLNSYKKFENIRAKNIEDIISIDREIRSFINSTKIY